MLEPGFDQAWTEDLTDDFRTLMARRFMEVTETLGMGMMAGQPDWRQTDVGVVVVVTPNICKYYLIFGSLSPLRFVGSFMPRREQRRSSE